MTVPCRAIGGKLNIPYCIAWNNKQQDACNNYAQAVPGRLSESAANHPSRAVLTQGQLMA
jgi:hypothetical protein